MRLFAAFMLFILGLLVAGASADPQQPQAQQQFNTKRLVGYVPPQSNTGCPNGMRVQVYARAGSGGWGGPGAGGATVTGSVVVQSPYPVPIAQVDVALYPTAPVSPLRTGCNGLDGVRTASGSCSFGVALPNPAPGSSSYGARSWSGAASRVWLQNGGYCDSAASMITGTDSWGDLGANLGGTLGQLTGQAAGGNQWGSLGGLIGSAIGQGIAGAVVNGGNGGTGVRPGYGSSSYYGGGGGGGGLGGMGSNLYGGFLGRRLLRE
jgi:hypothetical protein